METSTKSSPSTAQRGRPRLVLSWLLFLVFVALLGFGIVVYAHTTTHVSGLAMAVIGILGLGVLATSLRLSRATYNNERRGGVYTGGFHGVAGVTGVTGATGAGGPFHQHNQWSHHHMWWQQQQQQQQQQQEQARRNDEYNQQVVQQQTFQMQQQAWNQY